ncbi:unnamed protein product [Orchesella dallaii]|uniref:EF-hand domain-containing protein n=1 Tax=Orchesella dallaii TaxID=48710 RepID=A0ABP1RPT2_9HEXA
MGKFSSPLGLIILCALVSLFVSENRVSGQCCRSTGVKWGRGVCGDDTRPSPCCGRRACNFFCCNCSDGGCRGRRWARDVNAVQQGEHEHDKNKDGFYEKHEVHNLLLSGSCGNYSEKVGKWETEFQRMDKDKDGKLSYEEINAGAVFTLIVTDNQVTAQCCRERSPSEYWHSSRLSSGSCADGTSGTPCCGVRSCNIFCCNCSDGGCRGRRWARDLNARHLEEHEHDKNQDGFYSKKEIHNLILSGKCGNSTENSGKWELEFHRMDKDKDGMLSYEEIHGRSYREDMSTMSSHS